MSWLLFNDFPREMCFPSRGKVVYNMKEMSDAIGTYNGKCTVFTSLYAFKEIEHNKGVYDSAKIRQIFFDFDNPLTSLSCVRKCHNYCKERDLKHTMIFSGGGFHFYIAALYPNFLNDKKTSIGNAQHQIATELGFKVGIDGEDPEVCLDGHIIGNVAQLVRVPNTWNIRRRRFCIPISEEDIKTLTLEGFKELAKKQRLVPLFTYGRTHLDLKPYDGMPFERNREMSDDFSVEGDVEVNLDSFPPCIKFLSQKRILKHRERFLFILYCRQLGVPLNSTLKALRGFLDSRTYNHSVNEERQPLNVYGRRDLVFPRCETLKEMGYCKREKDCEGLKI